MSETTEQGAPSAPTPLADIFNQGREPDRAATGGQPDAETDHGAAPQETGEQATEVTDGRTRDAQGRFSATEATAAPPAAEDDVPLVPRSALQSERSKRQEAEQKASDLQRQLAEFQRNPPAAAQPQPEPIAIPNPAVDPAGYHRAMTEVALNERLNVSEMMAREKYADLDDKLAVFQAEIAANPALGQQIATQRHPWDWMYQEAKKIEARKAIGDDPVAFRERVRAELLAEMKATEGSPPPAAPPAPARNPLPASLATARGVGERTTDTFRGPTPLSEIFGRNR